MRPGEREWGAIEILKKAGIANPLRLSRVIKTTIEALKLNLSGLSVLTEAASGPFVVTSVMAKLAGAKRVIALTRDSEYARTEEVIEQTQALESLCGLAKGVEICQARSLDLFSDADIVTNLGFVRPIDGEAVAAMKPTAVVSLMCETWEVRHQDIDLEACCRKGIAFLGTNEDYPPLEVFNYSAWLCLKMLFAAQIEVFKSKVLIVGGDKFASVIARQLENCGIWARTVPHLRDSENLQDIDALVIADYSRKDMIIGPQGDLTASELANRVPGLTVVQFAGQLDLQSLKEMGVHVFPDIALGPGRMARTLAELGAKPVIELHGLGLKVGEALARARLTERLDMNESVAYALKNSPAQDFKCQLRKVHEQRVR